MVESFNKTSRLIFEKGNQKKLLNEFCKKQNFTQKECASFFKIARRSFTDWLNEKTTLPFLAYEKIPDCIRKKYPPIKTLSKFWYAEKGARLGGMATYTKYGKIPTDEHKRKKAFKEWWLNDGRFSSTITQPKKITLTTEKTLLAEAIGILLGDGGITKYQINITLHKKDDYAYSKYVANLFGEVFGTKPSVIENKKHNFLNVRISRSDAVKKLLRMGMKIGNKVLQQVDIPAFIKKSKNLSKYCLKGLFDTDGCVFIEKHKNSPKYKYLRLNLTNHSKPIIKFAFETLQQNNILCAVRRNGKAVQVENLKEICNYAKVIGSSNPKHLLKINNFRRGV